MTTDGIPHADPAAPGNFASEAKVQGHSPGPWVVDVPNSNLVAQHIGGVYHYIADCQPWHWSQTKREWPEIDANARLIAAAPELLVALRGMLDSFGAPKRDEWLNDDSWREACERCDIAQHAIAKATAA